MEEKVQVVLKLIEEDGDSFARRAEMYYKKRPELINFVQEFYRAYRALADRYDHISTELQNANNTIASVFPEQVQFSMDEEDEEAMPKFTKKPPEIPKANIPKVPKAPIDLKTVITTATQKLKTKKSQKSGSKLANIVSTVVANKSGLTKPEALQEIDKLQKQILALQTEKEFLKSSYESGLAKYWEIENQIKEMQDRVFNLQDEYGEGMVIEDDDARNLMAKAALKSCQESLAQLQEKQEKSAEEARIESTRIKEARERLESLKGKLKGDPSSQEKSLVKNEPVRQKEPDRSKHVVENAVEEKQRAEEVRQKIKEQLETTTCLTMTEMAEKIDELVNKVISLESALSSQTALVKQLRSETDELHTQIRTLEDDKASIIDGKNNLQQKLKEMEQKLGGIQDLNQKVENEKTNFTTQIIEVHCNLDHLSEKLPSVQQDVELEPKSSTSTEEVEQLEKLPSMKLGASGPHTELEQPDKKLKAHEGSNDPKQMKSDEACQVTDSRRSEEPVADMKSSEFASPKEEESQNFKGKSEKADVSDMNINQENTGLTQVDSPNLGSSSKKLAVSATSRSLLEVVETQDKSQSSKGSYEKSDADDAAKSQEEIVQTLSVNSGADPEKNDVNGSARNPVEIVQTVANSQYSNFGREEAGGNATSTSQAEAPQTQDKSESLKGTSEKSDADNSSRSREEIVQASLVNIEGTTEKNGTNGSAGNPVEVVQTSANSQYLEGGGNGTRTSQAEEIYKQADLGHPSEKTEEAMKEQNKEENKTFSEAIDAEQGGKVMEKEDEPNWQQLFMSGIEDREKVLLTEYTTTLRNFKDVKKKLNEMDEKNRDHKLQTSKLLNELKTSNALKDQEIRSLRHKLNLMQKCFTESKESVDLSKESLDFSPSDHQEASSTSEDQNIDKITRADSIQSETPTPQIYDEEEDSFDISKLLVQQPTTISVIEEKLRMKIDELLEENLDFWLKFSTSFHQIQKFETGIQDLKSEVKKLQEKGKKMDESGSGNYSLKSEARPLYKHLREIQTELTVWSDKSAALKEELQNRFSSLCNIQEEITAGLKASAEDDDFSFTSYQAAKFQGEVLNMKQENNKVADELQAALDHIASLQLEVDTTLSKLNEEFRLAGSKKQETPQLQHSESRNRVPLRSFIFGVKPKKQKQSIFSGMAPVMQKKYHALRTGTPM